MRRALVLLGLSALLLPAAARPDIIGTSGQATAVSPPSSVEDHTGSISEVFVEQTLVLPSPVAVDASGPGTYASLASLNGGTIAAGTDVASYYLHSFGPDISGNVFAGSITFSTQILGVEALTSSVSGTDASLGLATTTYFTGNQGQGFELDGSQIDQFSISADGRTLTYLDETFNAPDDLRIITAASATVVPEPSSLVLLGMGLFCAICVLIRKLVS